MAKRDEEYKLNKAVSDYLKFQYPKVIYHVDYAGLNLSKSQAGKMKAIQGGRGYPDVLICEPSNGYHGLFLELKATNIYKKSGELLKDKHLYEQRDMMEKLRNKGYSAMFSVGFDDTKKNIDDYLTPTKQH